MTTIDLNADLGVIEGAAGEALDDSLLRVVTSANVACGGHAGSAESMARVCVLAARYGVAVGAQVSYDDRAGFGRRRLHVAAPVLAASLRGQLVDLESAASGAGTAVTYVKPHGALYHAAAEDPAHAGAVVDAALEHGMHTGRPLTMLGQAGSVLLTLAAAAGLPVVAEAFADRGYTTAARLVPRGEPGDLVHDPEVVVERVLRLATAQEVVAVDGTVVPLPARSVCLHSDTPGAGSLARAVRDALRVRGVTVLPFAPPPRRG